MKPSFLCALGATCLIIGVAQADLKWTESMKIGGTTAQIPAGMNFSIQTTRYMNAEASRTDTTSNFGPMKMVTRQIDLCPTKKTLNFFDEGKLYSEEDLHIAAMLPPMAGMGGPMGGMPGMGGAPQGNKPKKTGTQTVSFNLRDLGTEKILDIDTHHYALDTSITSTGCAGNSTNKTSIEAWQADIPIPAPCLATTFEDTIKSSTRTPNDCDVKMVIEGDMTPVTKVFNNFMMRMKLGMGGMTVTREVTMLSRAPVGDEIFAVPTDYRKVTDAELEKARQAAMMKSMMGGMGGMTGGGDDGTPDAPDTDN
ncbi:hypothetical protein EON83_00820 [bacterium]|nr:MAG: hypothetical protein EON83_00820 [bacterium]